jgi:hypothetical protein
MTKIISTLLLCLSYVSVGLIAEKYSLITEPAYWAFYGSTFGFIAAINATYGSNKK